MRTHTTFNRSVTRWIHRFALGLAMLALASTSTMNSSAEVQAAGFGNVSISYFNAIPAGVNVWYVDGIVEAFDMSSISVTMGGAASSVGTITPDSYGHFSCQVGAYPGDYLSANATDGVDSSMADLTLQDFGL